MFNNIIENKQIDLLFPTPLFKMFIADRSIVDNLKSSLISLRDSNKMIGKSNMSIASNNYLVSEYWQTEDDLYNHPEFLQLTKIIESEFTQILDYLSVDCDGFYINNMWGNISYPLHMHHYHIHPNSYYSGLIYISSPNGCSTTVFQDTRPNSMAMFEPTYSKYNDLNSSTAVITPDEGHLLFWPSWMPHAVMTKNVDEKTIIAMKDQERMTIAFTIMLIGKNKRHTRKIEWK